MVFILQDMSDELMTFGRLWRRTGMTFIISIRASLLSQTQLPKNTGRSIWSRRWSSWREILTWWNDTKPSTLLIT